MSILSHPSLLKVPEDFERYRAHALATAPLLINAAEVDAQFPPEKQRIVDELMMGESGGAVKGAYNRTYWEGCEHGFAVSVFYLHFVAVVGNCFPS